MFETGVSLPPGLAQMAPGPELAATLAGIDRARVASSDMVTVLVAQARQVAHEQSRMFADLVEVAHCLPSTDDTAVARSATVGEFAAVEIAAALTWTRQAAQQQLSLAYDVVQRLPRLAQALAAGHIDTPKARCVSDAVAALDDHHAQLVVDRILHDAPRWTTGQLRHHLARLILQIDPHGAARRRDRAIRQRRTVLHAENDGTATLTAYGLPPERAVAAAERIHAIAHATKATGDPRSLDQLRADTLLDLLLGVHPLAQPGPRRGVIELRVPLETLLESADEPADLAGYGPIAADIARRIVRDQHAATWRYSVYNGDTLIHHGTTRRRPTSADAAYVKARDHTCRAPGCRVPARYTDLDHLVEWANNGPSTVDNLTSLCRHHHTARHKGGWTYQKTSATVINWRSPLGRTHTVTPDPVQRR